MFYQCKLAWLHKRGNFDDQYSIFSDRWPILAGSEYLRALGQLFFHKQAWTGHKKKNESDKPVEVQLMEKGSKSLKSEISHLASVVRLQLYFPFKPQVPGQTQN